MHSRGFFLAVSCLDTIFGDVEKFAGLQKTGSLGPCMWLKPLNPGAQGVRGAGARGSKSGNFRRHFLLQPCRDRPGIESIDQAGELVLTSLISVARKDSLD